MGDLGFDFGKKNIDGVLIERKLIKTDIEQVSLYYQKFANESFNKDEVNIVLLPEIQDHCHRYNEFAHKLALEMNFQVHSFDYYGFGRSDGFRTYMDVDQMFLGLKHCLQQIDNNKDIYQYGHGMGALQALAFCLLNDQLKITGQILESVWTVESFKRKGLTNNQILKLDTFKDLFIKVFSNKGQKVEDLVSSSDEIAKIQKDVLWFDDIVYGTILSGSLQTHYIKELLINEKPRIYTPVVVLQGKNDTITLEENTKNFVESLKGKFDEVELVVIDNCKHDIHTEHQDDVCKKISAMYDKINSAMLRPKSLLAEDRLEAFKKANFKVENCVKYEFDIYHVVVPVLIVGVQLKILQMLFF